MQTFIVRANSICQLGLRGEFRALCWLAGKAPRLRTGFTRQPECVPVPLWPKGRRINVVQEKGNAANLVDSSLLKAVFVDGILRLTKTGLPHCAMTDGLMTALSGCVVCAMSASPRNMFNAADEGFRDAAVVITEVRTDIADCDEHDAQAMIPRGQTLVGQSRIYPSPSLQWLAEARTKAASSSCFDRTWYIASEALGSACRRSRSDSLLGGVEFSGAVGPCVGGARRSSFAWGEMDRQRSRGSRLGDTGL